MRAAMTPIRRVLDGLYRLSGFLAGASLIGICATVVAQIVGRLLGLTVDSTESAGLLLAAATFFGLAHTFRAGGHVRIALAIEGTSPRARRWIEMFNCALAAAAICFLAWHVTDLALQSYAYNDVSPGLLAIPFWIPQGAAAAGVALFAIALLDELVWIAAGRPPRYDERADGENAHYE